MKLRGRVKTDFKKNDEITTHEAGLKQLFLKDGIARNQPDPTWCREE